MMKIMKIEMTMMIKTYKDHNDNDEIEEDDEEETFSHFHFLFRLWILDERNWSLKWTDTFCQNLGEPTDTLSTRIA